MEEKCPPLSRDVLELHSRILCGFGHSVQDGKKIWGRKMVAAKGRIVWNQIGGDD
jgi:hypothetical protein